YIAEIHEEPIPRVDPVLLDHAFAFSPAGTLQLPELLASETRVRGLGIFPNFHFELRAREDHAFDVLFENWERNGLGDSRWEALITFFRGLPAQTVYPEVFNLRQEAINFLSMYRWDAQKRRVGGTLSGPLARSAKRRFQLSADLRSENWGITDSFTGSTSLLGSLNLRREAANAELVSFVSGRWSWSAGVEFSHRDFRSVIPGTALDPSLLTKGDQLKQVTKLNADIWRLPDRKVVLTGSVSSQLGRIWSHPSHGFEKLE